MATSLDYALLSTDVYFDATKISASSGNWTYKLSPLEFVEYHFPELFCGVDP